MTPRTGTTTTQKAAEANRRQPGLFDLAPSGDVVTPETERKGASMPLRIGAEDPPIAAPSPVSANGSIRVLGVDDMPDYPPSLVAATDAALATLPPNRLWFTYRDIRDHFGISRATVARRLRGGFVPGVSFANGRMLEDGPVRRFDRTQLRWLLMAVRRPGSGRGA